MKKFEIRNFGIVLFSISLLSGCVSLGQKESISVREGVTQPFFSIKAQAPVVNVILFAGAGGDLFNLGNNFLVRSRNLFVEQGFNVTIVDVPSDQSKMFEFRVTEEHARDIAGVIQHIRKGSNAPVWLIGTSMGTVSVANAAARLKENGPDGIVLTSSVFRRWRGKDLTIATPGLEKVTVPTLFVHHRDDGCRLTQYADLEEFVRKLTNSPKVEKIVFEGGSAPLSGPCRALSRHGYIGIEETVVKAIAYWIKKNHPM